MVTIEDVAKEAGVSIATVSRVLNRNQAVREATAKKVYAAIEKLHYEPNLMGRNLRKNESRVLLILTPNIQNPYYAHILSGIGDAASEKGYSALIYNSAEKPEREREAMDMLHRRRADGAILLASNLGCHWLKEYERQYPMVQCSEYDPEVDIAHVSIDNYAATCEGMEYLVKLGHTNIATISSENEYYSTRQRLRAYRDTMSNHGLPLREDYICYAARDYSFKSGRKAARALLNIAPRPTAIFCISDTLALGAVTAAREMGLRVPEDLSVIGFDDVDYTTMMHPYISTISQPCYQLGRHATEMLYDQIADKSTASRHQVLPHKLMVRETTAPIL